MKLLLNTKLLSIVSIALIFSFLTGCGTDHDDHGETPVGLELSINENVLATQNGSSITYQTGDQIFLIQGTTLGPISVQFIAEDGDRYQPDSNDGYALQFSTDDSNKVSIGQVSSNDEWTIQLTGAMTGDATITFELWHNDHSDFESRPFNVEVVSN